MKRTIRNFLIITTLCIFVALLYSLYNNGKLFYKSDEVESTKDKEIINVSDNFSLPARIIIPLLEINTTVNHVGLTESGAMATPGNFTDVGWYKYGTIPGNLGSAVIAGHLDNALAKLGVFKNLDKLKVGDDVYIEAKDGSRVHFKVVKTEKYPYDKAPAEKIFNDKTSAKLNLITCGGEWNKTLKTYTERFVVYTELVSD